VLHSLSGEVIVAADRLTADVTHERAAVAARYLVAPVLHDWNKIVIETLNQTGFLTFFCFVFNCNLIVSSFCKTVFRHVLKSDIKEYLAQLFLQI
jgi:hypothetical protein